jgi:prolyl-tRNA editing enzyme YbaK/EbsC (Cys-tRNA(Pro) deacylase)
MESLTVALSSLSFKPQTISHPEVDSLKAWVETIKNVDATAAPCKTLVLKPSKGPNNNLILVVSLESTSLSVGQLAKSLGYKDARMAGDNVVCGTFSTEKINSKDF